MHQEQSHGEELLVFVERVTTYILIKYLPTYKCFLKPHELKDYNYCKRISTQILPEK